MSRHRITIPSTHSRRMPDPVIPGSQRHILLVRAKDVPEGLPLDPNPRDQNINKRVYRDVLASLMNEDGAAPDTFHLKNKGITLIAAGVREVNPGEFSVAFDEGHGIVDGGHTYRVLLEGQSREGLSDEQYVKMEILVGVPPDLITDIAGGLNTAVQVQEMSLANLSDKFDWIKEALKGEPYESVIAYKENETEKMLDVRDVVAYMTLFNIDLYPNDQRSRYPITAYRAKVTALADFLKDENYESFKKMRKILPDILKLADTISHDARDLHNRTGGKAGKLAFVDGRKSGEYQFPFLGKTGPYKLSAGALYPMLGAFRWMVEEGADGMYHWKGSFQDVLALWDLTGGDLMRLTQAASDENGRNPNAIGKSLQHWTTLYSQVGFAQLSADPRRK